MAVSLHVIPEVASAPDGIDTPAATSPPPDGTFSWTPRIVAASLLLFVCSGFAEVGGGWLIWRTIRCAPVQMQPQSSAADVLTQRSS